jgi:hypothetical protein
LTHPKQDAFPAREYLDEDDHPGYSPGLSKREYFAAKAMEGLVNNPRFMENAMVQQVETANTVIARTSVAMADALISALNAPS